MIAAWMVFALLTGAALSVAAAVAERLATVAHRPRRVGWLVAMAATAAWPLATRVRMWATDTGAVPDGAPVARGVHRLGGIIVPVLPASETARWLDLALLTAWAVASAILVVRLVASTMAVRRWRRAWPAADVDGMRVRLSPDAGPAIVGLRPMDVVLPAWVLALDRAERALILRHEAEHRTARDPHALLFAALLTALVPWHLALWWQARRLRLAVELDCDARVLRADPRPAGYARLLLHIVARRSAGAPWLAPGLSGSAFHLERRILAMYVSSRGPSPLHRVALGATACAAVVVACAVDAPDRSTAPTRMSSADAAAATRAVTPPGPGTGEYFEFQVERQAATLPGGTTVHYPDVLKAAGISGDVLTQFVVDTTGHVEMSTVRVMRSSHPAFTAAVRAALPTWQFRPAAVRGHAVRQLVQMPVWFTPTRESAPGAG